MSKEVISEEERLFRQAKEIVMGEISLQERPDMAMPTAISARKLERAKQLLERVLQNNPENWPAMWYIGKIFQRFGNPLEALSWFERSYQINPYQPEIVREASICAMELGHHERAIFLANRAIEIQQNGPGLYANLALAYVLAGRIMDARIAIDRAIAQNPSDSISRTVFEIVNHFVKNNRVPPTTTSTLIKYWQRERKLIPG